MGRRPAGALLPAGPTTIELVIHLSDGSFETKVVVPIGASKEQMDSAIQRWLALAGQALAIGVENMSATLPKDAA